MYLCRITPIFKLQKILPIRSYYYNLRANKLRYKFMKFLFRIGLDWCDFLFYPCIPCVQLRAYKFKHTKYCTSSMLNLQEKRLPNTNSKGWCWDFSAIRRQWRRHPRCIQMNDSGILILFTKSTFSSFLPTRRRISTAKLYFSNMGFGNKRDVFGWNPMHRKKFAMQIPHVQNE